MAGGLNHHARKEVDLSELMISPDKFDSIQVATLGQLGLDAFTLIPCTTLWDSTPRLALSQRSELARRRINSLQRRQNSQDSKEPEFLTNPKNCAATGYVGDGQVASCKDPRNRLNQSNSTLTPRDLRELEPQQPEVNIQIEHSDLDQTRSMPPRL